MKSCLCFVCVGKMLLNVVKKRITIPIVYKNLPLGIVCGKYVGSVFSYQP